MRPDVQMPASELFESVVKNPHALAMGRRLNSVYGRLASSKRYDEAKHMAEEYLDSFTPEEQLDAIRGAIVSAHLNNTSTAVVWQWGIPDSDGNARPGIRERTVRALTEIGMKCQSTSSEIIYYSPGPPRFFMIHLVSVWLCYYRRYCELKGLPVPKDRDDIPVSSQTGQEVVMLPDGTRRFTQVWAKKQIQGLVDQGRFKDREVSLQKRYRTFAALNEEGVHIANLSEKYNGGIRANCKLMIRLPVFNDGNLICIVERI
jgi:hypothetical protein